MSDKLTAAEAVEEISKAHEKWVITQWDSDFVVAVTEILDRVSPQAEPTQEGVHADSIRRARDREWCNRLEIQETLRPDDKELDVHLAFLCRKKP